MASLNCSMVDCKKDALSALRPVRIRSFGHVTQAIHNGPDGKFPRRLFLDYDSPIVSSSSLLGKYRVKFDKRDLSLSTFLQETVSDGESVQLF